MWKVTQHKSPRAQQDIQVSILVKTIAEHCHYATCSEQLQDHFNDRLMDVKRTNSFEAHHFYKMKAITTKSVEIWKYDIKGDPKHKIFTLDYEQVNHSNIPCC